jgi:DeoR family glycerol-3-phosphate regulon repressor
MIEMAPLKAVHTLFTDRTPATAQQRLMEDLGVRCVVAKKGANTADAQGAI